MAVSPLFGLVVAVIALLCLSYHSSGFAAPEVKPARQSPVVGKQGFIPGWETYAGGDFETTGTQSSALKAIGLSAAIGCAMGASRLSTRRKASTKDPAYTYKVVIKGGEARLHMDIRDIFFQSIVTGFYIGFGGTLCSTVGGSLPANFHPGLQRFIFGAVGFPLSIFLTTIAGGQGFTPNIAVMATALYRKGSDPNERAQRLWRLLGNLLVAYAGNTIGLLTIAKLANLAALPAVPAAVLIAKHKLSYGWLSIIVRGILGGWLIGLAVWTAQAAESMASKFITIWLCIGTYVICQYEHCLANLFFVPCAIFSGADITWETFILRNLIPATLGNLIGGFGMLAGTKRAVYGRQAFRDELIEQGVDPVTIAAAPDAVRRAVAAAQPASLGALGAVGSASKAELKRLAQKGYQEAEMLEWAAEKLELLQWAADRLAKNEPAKPVTP